jgi:hypothetical protein
MFIKRRPVPGKPSSFKIQICESYRKGDKVLQRIVKHIGTARSEMELRVLEKSAHLFMEESFQEKHKNNVLFDARDSMADCESTNPIPSDSHIPNKTKVDISELQEIKRQVEGPKDIFGYAAEAEGLLEVVAPKDRDLLADLIAARITEPASKNKTHEILGKYAGFDCSIDSIYRLITKLGKSEELVN